MKKSDKSPVRPHDKAKQINTDAESSSSSADSDSTCSMVTPSLEFPDRISFRKMDLSEAGPSGVVITSNSRNLDTSNSGGVEGVMDLSEAGPSCVVTSNSTNRDITKFSFLLKGFLDITKFMPPVRRRNKTTLIRRNHSSFKEIIARMKKSSGRRGDKITPVRRLERRDAAKHINYDAASSSSSSAEDLYVSASSSSLSAEDLYVSASSSSLSAEDLYVSASSSSLEVPDRTSFRIGGAEGENRGGIERKPTILVKSKGYLVPNVSTLVYREVLKPHPSLKQPPIDLQRSSSGFLTHFAPENETVRQPSSSSSSKNGCDLEEVETEDTRGMFNQLRGTGDETCSFTTNEGDSSRILSNTSPICASGGFIITSWQKGQLLGRGSFGSVYEGISGDGDFFAINEVSLLDQGSPAQECIQHLERDIGLLNHHVNSDAMSSSSSSVSSNLTSSLMTPSMEFPDRISFRKIDLTEAGPSGIVADRENTESTRSESIAIGKFNNPEDMVLVTSWLNDQLLGRRSFDTIYEDISVDQDFFAVKEVSFLDQGSQTEECIQQLEGEIALLTQLQHQNIVRYRGTAKDGSNLYIFLELVTQGSLLQLYQRYRLRNSVVSTYTRQILDGLKYLHDKGFIHRDIKCANILVDANGVVKLADFGLAKVSKFNDIKSCKGTPFWMAPEVINPKRNDGYGSPADIWSLGCTVLEMLTGQIPYGNLEPVQALFRIGRGSLPEIPDTLSLDAQNFVIECLKVNPEERPTAAELLNHPFVRRPLPSMGSGGLVLASPLLHRQG